MEVEVLESRYVPSAFPSINVYVTGSVTTKIAFTDPNRFNDGSVSALHEIGTTNNFVATNLRSAVVDHNTFAGTYNIYLETATYNLTQGQLEVEFPGGPGALAFNITNLNAAGGGISTIKRNTGTNFRIFQVDSGGTTTLDHLELTNGNATNGIDGSATGGAILNEGNLILTYDQIDGNAATGYGGEFPEGANGGGVYNASGASLNIRYSTFDHNTATAGNETSDFGLRAGAEGGGVFVRNGSGTVSITASTFSNNTAQGGNNTFSDFAEGNGGNARGGGISIGTTGSNVAITNSTFANNTAQGGNTAYGGNRGGSAYGGGISADNNHSVELVNDTIALNHAIAGSDPNHNNGGSAQGGGIKNFGVSTSVKLVNNIIASNTVQVTGHAATPGDVYGAFDDLGHNLIGNTTNGTGFTGSGDLLNQSAGLNPNGLQNNGGPTLTIALAAGSKAIDAGDSSVTTNSPLMISLGLAPLTYDQRGPGFARLSGPAVDIGAFEVQVAKKGRDLLYG
jgi:hypothetical protein